MKENFEKAKKYWKENWDAHPAWAILIGASLLSFKLGRMCGGASAKEAKYWMDCGAGAAYLLFKTEGLEAFEEAGKACLK